MMWHLAGSDRKHDLYIGVYSLVPKDTSEYLGCHYSMHISWFRKSWKSWFWVFFLAVFPCKNDFFIWSGRKCPESYYMAGNGDPRCRRLILHQNLISKHVSNEIWEIRKNRFSKFLIMIFRQIWPTISHFQPIIGQITLGLGRIPLKLFPNKMAVIKSVLLLRYKVICKKSTFSPNQCNVRIMA